MPSWTTEDRLVPEAKNRTPGRHLSCKVPPLETERSLDGLPKKLHGTSHRTGASAGRIPRERERRDLVALK